MFPVHLFLAAQMDPWCATRFVLTDRSHAHAVEYKSEAGEDTEDGEQEDDDGPARNRLPRLRLQIFA